jgi:hypothetical protein
VCVVALDFSEENDFPERNLLLCGGNAPQEVLRGQHGDCSEPEFSGEKNSPVGCDFQEESIFCSSSVIQMRRATHGLMN